VPELEEEARRNSVETKKNRGKSSNCDSYVTCTVFLINCFVIKLVLCNLYLKKLVLAGLLFDTFSITV